MKKILLVGIILSFTSLLIISCDSDTVPPEQIVDETNNGFESFEVAEIFASSCATSRLRLQKYLQAVVLLPAAIWEMRRQVVYQFQIIVSY